MRNMMKRGLAAFVLGAAALGAVPSMAQSLAIGARGDGSETLVLPNLTPIQAASAYTLEWSGDDFMTVQGTQKMALSGTSMKATVSGLTAGKTYQYRAKRSGGWVSNLVKATAVPLQAPKLDAPVVTAQGVSVSWSSPPPTQGLSFKVEWSNASNFSGSLSKTVTGNQALLPLTAAGSTWYIRVTCVATLPTYVGPRSTATVVQIPGGALGQ